VAMGSLSVQVSESWASPSLLWASVSPSRNHTLKRLPGWSRGGGPHQGRKNGSSESARVQRLGR
jgi:hypothetical protein